MQRIQFIKGLLAAAVGGSLLPNQKSTVFQKIYLLQCFIAGFRFYSGKELLSKFRVGDILTLEREPQNPYDANAIALYWRGTKIGFVPAQDNAVLSRLLDANSIKIVAEITHIEKKAALWESIAIAISQIKEVDYTEAKNNPIPTYLTMLEMPEYRTISSQKAGDFEDEFDVFNSSEVVFKMREIPQNLPSNLKKILDTSPEFSIKEESFCKITTDNIYEFYNHLLGGEYIEDGDGFLRLKAIFVEQFNL